MYKSIEKKLNKAFYKFFKNAEKDEKHIEIKGNAKTSCSNSFKIKVFGTCQEHVDDCDVAQECGIDKPVLCKWKHKNCDAACTEQCKLLTKIPNGHSTSNQRQFNANVTSICQKNNTDKFPCHFDILFQYNFGGWKIDMVSNYFIDAISINGKSVQFGCALSSGVLESQNIIVIFISFSDKSSILGQD